MFKLTFFLKFEKNEEGNKHTHSGNHSFKGSNKQLCWWLCDEEIDDFIRAGWVLIEQRLIKTEVI